MLCHSNRFRKATVWTYVVILASAWGCREDSEHGRCMTRYKSEMTSGFQVGNLRINKQLYGQQPVKADMPLVLTLDVFDEQQVLSKLESPSDLDQLIASVYTDTGLVFCRFERTGKRNGNMDTFQALLSGLPAGKYRSEIVIQRRAKTGASGVTMHTLRSYPLVVRGVTK